MTWVDRFKCELQIGETDYIEKLITIRNGLDRSTTFWTFFHEMQHAISEELGLRLTERQVNGLEIGLAQAYVDNGWGDD